MHTCTFVAQISYNILFVKSLYISQYERCISLISDCPLRNVLKEINIFQKTLLQNNIEYFFFYTK